jgi:lambda family phage portal protein
MNVLDRIIGFISPSRGLRRARARAAMRIYEGASPGRRANSWRASATSANTEIKQALGPMRDRARDLVRNTPHAPRMLDVFTSHIVGTGIRPVSATGRDKLDDRVERLFKDWQESADIEGVDSFYSLQRLALRSIIESGEVIVRMIDRSKQEATSAVPLHLQMLESDFIDSTMDGILQGKAPPDVLRSRLGVGLGDYDVRKGLWLFNQHPGEQTTYASAKDAYMSHFVANDQLIHLFGRNRPGQVRGVSWFAPMITTARDFSDLMDAVTVKARIEACFAAFITQADDLDGPMEPSANVQGPSADNPNAMGVTLEPGMMKLLRPGQDVKFAQPTSTSQIESVMMFDLMSMASAVGVTYDQLSGDLRGANYSSLRAGKIDFRALCEQVQELILIPRLCNRIWKRFIERAILAGELADRKEGYPVEFITPAWQSINPKFDEDAEMRSVRAGRMTPQQYMAGWGGNWRRNIRSIKEFYDYLDQNEVAVEIDVRNYTRAGSHQPPQPGVVPAGTPTAPGESPPAAVPGAAPNGKAPNGAAAPNGSATAASVMLVDENGDPIDLTDLQELVDQAEERGQDLAGLLPFRLATRPSNSLAGAEANGHIEHARGGRHADRPKLAPPPTSRGRSDLRRKRADWDEDEHPRDQGGKFADKGGGDEGGGKSDTSSSPAATTSTAKTEKTKPAPAATESAAAPAAKPAEAAKEGAKEGAKEAAAPAGSQASASDLYQAGETTTDVDKAVESVPGARESIDKATTKLAGAVRTDALVADGGHRNADGSWTAERQAIHEQILNKVFTPEAIAAATPKAGEKPVLTVLGGRGGSGKSWFTSSGLVDRNTAIYVNSDDFKVALPEYEGWNAALVHEESTYLALRAEKIASELGVNVIEDATMRSSGSTKSRIETFTSAGYTVHGYYMYVSPQEAMQRALGRFVRGAKGDKMGRFIAPEYLAESKTNEATFDSVKGDMAKWAVYDNMGKKPKLHGESG